MLSTQYAYIVPVVRATPNHREVVFCLGSSQKGRVGVRAFAIFFLIIKFRKQLVNLKNKNIKRYLTYVVTIFSRNVLVLIDFIVNYNPNLNCPDERLKNYQHFEEINSAKND